MDIPKKKQNECQNEKEIENNEKNAKKERRAARPASSRPLSEPPFTRSIVHPEENERGWTKQNEKETMETNDGRHKGRIHIHHYKRNRKRLDESKNPQGHATKG